MKTTQKTKVMLLVLANPEYVSMSPNMLCQFDAQSRRASHCGQEEVGEGQDFNHRRRLRTFDPWHTDLSCKVNQLVNSNSIMSDCTQAP